MATLIKPNGVSTTVTPKGRAFTLEELYRHIECDSVERIHLPDGREMWLDEEGKFKESQEVNSTATKLLSLAGGIEGDYVTGTVLLMTVQEAEADREGLEY